MWWDSLKVGMKTSMRGSPDALACGLAFSSPSGSRLNGEAVSNAARRRVTIRSFCFFHPLCSIYCIFSWIQYSYIEIRSE